MNLKQLKDLVDNFYLVANRSPEEIDVKIVVKRINSIGATPTVGVCGISMGFDWNSGKLLIEPETNLRTISDDELEAKRKESSEDGWVKYENMGLRSEVKKLQKRIKELEENAAN